MYNFVAVGNDELGLKVKKGDVLVKGDLRGILEYAKDVDTGEESSVLGFVKPSDGKSYLASIDGRLAFGWQLGPNLNTQD